MGRAIFITSFKGGVGKTSVTANLASALAALGNNVLVVDGDFGMRCMDLVLGLENDCIYSCFDILTGICGINDATIKSEYDPRLAFMPAPVDYRNKNIEKESLKMLFKELRILYDYILIDSSAEESPYYTAFAEAADDALVVSQHTTASIRAAEKTGMRLSASGFKNLRLIVNMYYREFAGREHMPGLIDIIQRSRIRLLGVVPYDQNLILNYENGIPAFHGTNKKLHSYEAAFLNIAGRITGSNTPLLKDVYRTRKNRFK